MKRILFLFFLVSTLIYAQKQKITLEDIWTKYSFSTERLESFHSMKKGEYYTVLNNFKEGTWLDKYSYATLKKVETIVSGNDLIGIKYFDDYIFNEKETKIIIGDNIERIFINLFY